uniref:class I tRNA ligase family protein n=1 Tax=Zhenhengia sp. TaxID=2944208 RepID=UPI0030796171
MMQKHYDAVSIEKEMQQLWEENDIYSYRYDNQKQTYSIDTPPPTVSGQLHIGHIFSYTQAEIIARFKRMHGYNIFYPFGFDDNGLPTERLVEKEYHLLARNLSREEMTTKCTEVAQKYEHEFTSLWKSMGFSVDWNLQYETINPTTTRISQRLFLDLVKKGKAYTKEAPVLWCTECQTSIAQAELETVEKDTSFNYIPFEVDNEQLIVATTRPELLYGVVALFINSQDSRYKKYIGKKAITPLYKHEIPILGETPKTICKCGGTTFIPETAVMDTWATSSITPQINRKWHEHDERLELEIPMSLRTQAHEIIRTWAFYTIVRSLYHTGKLPWKDIMISGFVLAKKGEKISKSKNNGKLSPKTLITEHSADALRYWAANTKLGADTFFSESELMPSKRFMNKLWNASKFSFMHLQDFDKNLLLC